MDSLPLVRYDLMGDFLLVVLSNDLFSARAINRRLTVHKSFLTNSLCGFQLWQVSRLASGVDLNSFSDGKNLLRFMLDHNDVKADDNCEYLCVAEKSKSISIPQRELDAIASVMFYSNDPKALADLEAAKLVNQLNGARVAEVAYATPIFESSLSKKSRAKPAQ